MQTKDLKIVKNKLKVAIFFLLFCSFFEVKAEMDEFELEIYEPVPAEAIMDPIAKKFFRGIINCMTGWVGL